MLTTTLAIVGAAVASVAALAGSIQVYLLRRQTEQATRVALATLYQQIARQFIEFDQFMVDRAHLYPYFYEDKAMPLLATERAEVRMTAEMIFDMAEFCHANAAVLGKLANNWDNYFYKLYQSSPALRAYADEYGHFYPPRILTAFQSGDVDSLPS